MEQPDITDISCTGVDYAHLGGKPVLSAATRKTSA